MKIVKIPFRQAFRDAVLSGQKVCTARTKRLGAGGDRFQAFGEWFDVKSVESVDLTFVADLWMQEGCNSREHFIEVWSEIHSKRGYRPDDEVYLHRFKKVTKETTS